MIYFYPFTKLFCKFRERENKIEKTRDRYIDRYMSTRGECHQIKYIKKMKNYHVFIIYKSSLVLNVKLRTRKEPHYFTLRYEITLRPVFVTRSRGSVGVVVILIIGYRCHMKSYLMYFVNCKIRFYPKYNL